jgi:hypothetical protein
MDTALRVTVLRSRSQLSEVACDCAELALNCIEPSRLDQYRYEGTRCVLVWEGAGDARRLAGLFPFGAPALYLGLPLLALRSPTPLIRQGWAEGCVQALLDWFRLDGEGAALLEIRGLRRGGPVYRAFAEVAGRREQLVLCATAPDKTRTLLLGDRAWGELTLSSLPLSRWAKLSAAKAVYAGAAVFAPL